MKRLSSRIAVVQSIIKRGAMSRRAREFDAEQHGLPTMLRNDYPKGDQIREIIEILAPKLPPGEALPSERRLAEYYGVARMTVRGEMRKLAAEGILRIQSGVGAYPAEPGVRPYGIGYSFSREIELRGGRVGSIVQEHNVLRVTSRMAELLGVPQGTRALRLLRVRTVDELPTGVEQATLPLERFPGLELVDFERASLHETLRERFNVEPASVSGKVAATRPSAEYAELLDIEEPEPCLEVTITLRDASGNVIEVGRSVYRGDRYNLGVSRRMQSL